VYVSHAEATAYGKWLGRKLRPKLSFIARHMNEGRRRSAAIVGRRSAWPVQGNFDFKAWDLCLWDHILLGTHSACMIFWERVGVDADGVAAFQASRPCLLSGYSAISLTQPLCDEGCSPRTAACMLRRSFRNWSNRIIRTSTQRSVVSRTNQLKLGGNHGDACTVTIDQHVSAFAPMCARALPNLDSENFVKIFVRTKWARAV